MLGSQRYKMRWWLFFIFVTLFVIAYGLTILALFFGLGNPDPEILNRLTVAFIFETGGAVIALFYSLFGLSRERGRSPVNSVAEDIEGWWWQFVHDNPGNALSFVEVRDSSREGQFQLAGEAYSSQGTRAARWRSTAAGFNASTLELFYFWRGDEYSEHDTSFSGIGVFKFRPSADTGIAEPAKGWSTSGDLHDKLEVTGKQIAELRRVESADADVMRSDDSDARIQLITQRYAEWAKSFQDANA